jgi:hypothetical protein
MIVAVLEEIRPQSARMFSEITAAIAEKRMPHWKTLCGKAQPPEPRHAPIVITILPL